MGEIIPLYRSSQSDLFGGCSSLPAIATAEIEQRMTQDTELVALANRQCRPGS